MMTQAVTPPPIPEGVPHADQPISLDWYLSAGLQVAIAEHEREIATALLRAIEFRTGRLESSMRPADVQTIRKGLADAADAIAAMGKA